MTTLAEAQSMVTAYLAAEQAILQGKEVRLGGSGVDRFLRHEDLQMVRQGRQEWERRVTTLQASAAAAPTFGGLGYSLADFSAPTR
jgi:hypothetical protein